MILDVGPKTVDRIAAALEPILEGRAAVGPGDVA